MKKELATKYNHIEVESGKYQKWLEKKYFEAGDTSKKAYSIVIPPPNVTGKLHLGHAWDTTLQDILIRYKRLQGYDALWLPGMDHAGIATQAKVEERLRGQGISRYDLGRDKFLEKSWEWKEEYATLIRQQWEKLGLSLDYSKERFTLDEGLSKAVRKVFVDLFKKGLIYQGERIINWDPAQKTALSNIEVIHKEVEGAMYYFKYLVIDSEETLVIATTRPETMFGDTAIFVHPDDERYKHLVGKKAINPANNQALPIMADDYIDMSFGSAVMKCTPAHDPNDFVLGKKYKMAMPICMNPDGTMNQLCGKYEGMDRFECRKQLVKEFDARGVVVKIETHLHQVGHSERSNAVVEPYLSKQWFVKMEPLAKEAIANQLNQETKVNFVPERFEKTFIQWMENIEDWCISRQLWWGHRVPVWYHKETGEIYVEIEDPKDTENYIQDPDVLDTWFSSALWPFSTLNWPNENNELFNRYFPTDALVTGYDIIFFWVSRMIFQSLQFTNQKPFKDVLIHGLTRDELGRKMSKSLGNGIEPMDVINQYGADSMRYFLATTSSPGQDLRYSEEKVEAAWNFINKIWNASRFVLMNIDQNQEYSDVITNTSLADQWILSKLNSVIKTVETMMDKYEFVVVGNELYSFIWDDFCSWYIELAKVTLTGDDEVAKEATKKTLVYLVNAIVKMLHPFMPFVTEEIYQSIPHIEESICISSWPLIKEEYDFSSAKDSVVYLIDIVKAIREIRATYQIKNANEIHYSIKNAQDASLRIYEKEFLPYVKKLCNAECLGFIDDDVEGDSAIVSIKDGHAIEVSLDGLIDMSEEIAKLEKELAKLINEITRCEKMLTNSNFVNKAPASKVEQEKSKLEDYKKQYETIAERLHKLK